MEDKDQALPIQEVDKVLIPRAVDREEVEVEVEVEAEAEAELEAEVEDGDLEQGLPDHQVLPGRQDQRETRDLQDPLEVVEPILMLSH
jgi:hypothetical protein